MVIEVVRILMIEDNPVDVDLFREYLENEVVNFEIMQAKILDEGLRLLDEFQFDIILLDLSLPDSFGLDTFTQTHSYAREIPIIVLTGNTDLSLAKKTVSLGAQDYLIKQYVNEYVLPRSIQHAIEREKSQRKFRENQDLLKQSQKMEAMGRLAGGIAHDFNNVLSVIVGYSELIMETSDLSEDLSANILEIKSAADKATSLIRQLLLFSRKQPILRINLNINKTINSMSTMLGQLIPEYIQLNFNLNPNIGLIHADKNQIQQVIMNLVINASDAIEQNGIINISTDNVKKPAIAEFRDQNDNQEYLILTVEDNGIGVKNSIKPYIFDPFFTTKEVGKGTGFSVFPT